MLKALSKGLISAVFPLVCELCRKPLPLRDGGGVCGICRRLLSPIREPFCGKCGRHAPCSLCSEDRFHFDGVLAACYYDGAVKKLLCSFKFRRRRALLRNLLRLLECRLLEQSADWDCVAAVPMHSWRRFERGFNQAELLASGVARFLEIPYWKNALRSHGGAKQQARLGKKEREQNVHRLFEARTDSASGKRILLVDDVMTTGRTASACARALKDAGAASVHALVVARGL